MDRDVLVRAIRYAIERHQMVNKLEQAQEELQEIARYDSLTGLSNRKFFYEQLDKLIERVRRENKIMAVMFLDLDNFKPINDVHGHSIGDLLLQSVAKRISSCLRKNDIAARLGGVEFIIAYDTAGSEENLAITARRIIEGISDIYILDGIKLTISASIGIVIYPKDSVDINMPEMDGNVVLNCMKANEKLCLIPVIMITGVDGEDNMLQYIEKGVEDYLPKPFNLKLLTARIKSSLERKQLQDWKRDMQF